MLASLTGLLLTLGGEGPAIVFIPPLDPEVFDWNPDDLSLRFVGELDDQGPRFDFDQNGITQSMVILKPVVFLRPSYLSADGYECVDGDGGGFIPASEGPRINRTASIEPRVINLGSISFGGSAPLCVRCIKIY